MAKTDPSGESPRSRLHQPPDLNLNEFFKTEDGGRTIVKNSDLEAVVPNNEKYHLVEENRYWVNKPYAFVVIYKSQRDQEYRYYLVEPYLTPEEKQLVGFLKDKIRHTLDFEKIRTRASERERAITLRETTFDLLREYNLISQKTLHDEGQPNPIARAVNIAIDKIYEHTRAEKMAEGGEFAGEETVELEWTQAQKIVYYIIRDFIRFDRIDGITADNKVEDVSIDGWNSSVFVVHTEYGQMITNVTFGEEDLDEFVTAIAQKAEKGISKRQPNVDATLQDGSRALLMLGDEVTDKGSNFTIRQFNNIPFTPIDLINWQTYTLDQMVYLWLAVENHKSAIVAGGTASGKTTTLNAISMFIPATNKIVSIEDTREIQIPQSNWVPLVTRQSFGEESTNRIDEFDLLRDSLRMRPNYVIFGEVRGEEARSLFQNLNTGHTTYATFHAKNSEQVRVRLTTDPINVDETSFGGLDLILNQQEVSISGHSERRAKQIVELREYDASDEKFQIETPFVWNQATDEVEGELTTPDMDSISPLIDEIRHENGWSREELHDEINRRRVVLSYLLSHEMTAYTQVAATLQGYMYSKESVLSAIAEDVLSSNTSQFRQMKNIDFEVSPEAEENVPRPPVRAEKKVMANEILNEYEELYMDVSVDARYQQPVSELEGETTEPPTETDTPSDNPDTENEYGYYTSEENRTETDNNSIAVAEGNTVDSSQAETNDVSDEPAPKSEQAEPLNGKTDDTAEEFDLDTEQPDSSDVEIDDGPDESTFETEQIESPEEKVDDSSDESELKTGQPVSPDKNRDTESDGSAFEAEQPDSSEAETGDETDEAEQVEPVDAETDDKSEETEQVEPLEKETDDGSEEPEFEAESLDVETDDESTETEFESERTEPLEQKVDDKSDDAEPESEQAESPEQETADVSDESEQREQSAEATDASTDKSGISRPYSYYPPSQTRIESDEDKTPAAADETNEQTEEQTEISWNILEPQDETDDVAEDQPAGSSEKSDTENDGLNESAAQDHPETIGDTTDEGDEPEQQTGTSWDMFELGDEIDGGSEDHSAESSDESDTEGAHGDWFSPSRDDSRGDDTNGGDRE